jgi:hypothetical protein
MSKFLQIIPITPLGFDITIINSLMVKSNKALFNQDEIDIINKIFGHAARIANINPDEIRSDRNPLARLGRLLVVSALSGYSCFTKRKWALPAFLGQTSSMVYQLFKEARNKGARQYPKQLKEISDIFQTFIKNHPSTTARMEKKEPKPVKVNVVHKRSKPVKKPKPATPVEVCYSDKIDTRVFKKFASDLLNYLNVPYTQQEIESCCKSHYESACKNEAIRNPTLDECKIFAQRILLFLGQKHLLNLGKEFTNLYSIDKALSR